MTANKALATLLCWALGLGVLGAMSGAALGYYAPGHSCRLVPLAGPRWDPTQTGIGSPQGLGIALALLLVAVVVIVCRSRPPLAAEPAIKPARERRWPFVTILVVGVLPTVFCSLMGFILGAVVRNQQIYAENVHRIEAILATGEFPDVALTRFSWVRLDLNGSVPSRHARVRLQNQLNSIVGVDEAEHVIRTVRVVPGSR